MPPVESRPQRAVIYARRSADDGPEESRSVADQVRDLTKQAEDAGWSVVEVCKDDGISGLVWDPRKRPGIFRVQELVNSGDVDLVLCWWPNRLSRDRRKREDFTDLCTENDVRIWAGESGYFIDRSTMAGWTQDELDSFLGAYQSKQISTNWKNTARRRREAGLTPGGKARFGYRNAGKGEAQVQDPATAPLLRELYVRYINGAGIQTLCREFNERSVPSPSWRIPLAVTPWTTQVLSRVLDSGFGAGLLITDVHSKPPRYLPGKQEPVITPEEWQAYRDSRTARATLAPKRRNPGWSLSGIARCGLCGGHLSVNTNTPGEKQTVICGRYAAGRACSGVHISKGILEEIFGRFMDTRLEELAATIPTRDAERAKAQQAVDEVSNELEVVVRTLGKLAEGWATGVLDDDGYKAARASQESERDRLTTALIDARGEVRQFGDVPEDLYDLLESAHPISPGELANDLRKIVRSVEVFSDRVLITPVIGDPEEVGRVLRTRGICSEVGCGKPHHSRGLCRLHYNRTHRAEYLREYRKRKRSENTP